ncbi:MAG: ureidoglycolate lyase [Rhodospirillaceae bacterium]|mgnify:CR=1 FL=1|jgi:ureidoglycolate lyase|nr:ureidoglycolate lyase [Rhodospirillaceae bacterium]
MDGSPIERRILEAKPATPEALAPYGQILGAGTGGGTGVSDFYEGAVAISKPVDFKSDDDTELTFATLQPRKFEIKYLERHFKHTQTFIPLGGKPFVAVFGAPTEGEMPDINSLEAFRFDGQAGFAMHIGTWHEFPFAIEADTNIVVILRHETMRNLSTENVKNDEAQGPDLDKKNLVQRTGVIFEIAV